MRRMHDTICGSPDLKIEFIRWISRPWKCHLISKAYCCSVRLKYSPSLLIFCGRLLATLVHLSGIRYVDLVTLTSDLLTVQFLHVLYFLGDNITTELDDCVTGVFCAAAFDFWSLSHEATLVMRYTAFEPWTSCRSRITSDRNKLTLTFALLL